MKMTKKEIIPSLSGFQYGYNSSIIAGALFFVVSAFSLSSFQEGLMVGATMIGMCLASFSAILANYTGRKKVLFLSVFLFLIGCLSTALTSSFALLLFGRVLIGFGSGIAIVAAPLYLVEVAPTRDRGKFLNMNQIGIASGSLLAYGMGYILGFRQDWRLMFAIGLIPALFQLIGLFFIPESLTDKKLAASSWKKVFEKGFRSRLHLILLLILFQALSGSVAIFFFAPRVFEKAGFDDPQESLLATLIIGVVYLLAILISFWVVDKLGRRALLITSFFGMGLSLLSLALFSYLEFSNFLTLVFVLIYIAFFSLGVGPIPPLVIGEISPTAQRGHMLALMGSIGWFTNYLIALTFLPLTETISLNGTFLIYAALCLIGGAISYKFLPETKQKSFEEIESLF